jgi:putative DNA-invertase from lambdoid prophage Rac
MTRVFAYARVSTAEQVTSNQRGEIAGAGYDIKDGRFVEEQISGSVCAFQRPGFKRLIDKLEAGDTLVVTKLDRIGRDSIDVQSTVEWFTKNDIRLIVLQLGNLDLTSSSGALMVKMLAAVADFERELIIERVQAGLARAKSEGKTLGRRPKTTDAQRQQIRERLAQGDTVSALARDYKVSRATILSINALAAA